MIKLITYIVSTLFTYYMGKVSKKKGWNEELPIAIQNIYVGILVFLISILACYVLKENVNYMDIIEQICVALGGSFTATWGYDTKKAINKSIGE